MDVLASCLLSSVFLVVAAAIVAAIVVVVAIVVLTGPVASLWWNLLFGKTDLLSALPTPLWSACDMTCPFAER